MEGYSAYVIPSEDILLGSAMGRCLSPVRRFFCLLVTFDLLFTILLWVVSIVLAKGGTSIIDAFQLEVVEFNFRTRLFDVVMSGGVRFVILLLFYAVVGCHHWFPVALTTTLTCTFLLVKVFLFRWESITNATYPVMLILSSFILAWSEAWFFDFRVIPQEMQAAMFHARQSANGVGGESQRVITWLGRSVSQIVQNAPHQRSYPESTADFFSLPESPNLSDDENEDSQTESMEKRSKLLYKGTPTALPESTECKMWLQHAPIMTEQLLTRVRSSGWVFEKSSDIGDSVFIQKSPRKIFMISGVVAAPPSKIAFELFQNFELMPHWNPAVIHCEILQRLNPLTDVSYQVSKDGAGGVVSPRDFVTLRHHQVFDDGTHVLSSVSVKHPAKPKQQKITRGTNGTGGWVFNPVPDQPSRTEFQWILDIDLNLQGWVPKSLVDSALIAASFETMKCLRNKLARTVDKIDLEIDPGAELSA